MPLTNTPTDSLSEIDVLICGGGTSGSALAARLATSFPHLSILLIEGGPNNADNAAIRHPALTLQNLVPGSKTVNFYQAKASESCAGREISVVTGGVLGGGSSVNVMLYSRAQGRDIEGWGWEQHEGVRLMEKIENYRGPGQTTHGHNGPVQVGPGKFRGKKNEDDFLKTAERLGYKIYDDLQNPELVNDGFEKAMRYVTPEGLRADAAHAYLHPLLSDGKHPNLHVLTETKVVRVLFDDDKLAVGVECVPNPEYHTSNETFTIKAKKQVVLSSGGIGTPLVLQRSGVGDPDVLRKASVPVVADVKGVGREYDDHTLCFYSFKTNLLPGETLDGLFSGRMSLFEAQEIGLLSYNAIDVHGKLRPTDEEVEALGPRFKAIWDRDFKDHPNKPLILMGFGATHLGDHSNIQPGQYATVAIYSAYNQSRGHVYITGHSFSDPIDFDIGFFKDEDDFDLKVQMLGYKKARALIRSTDLYKGELESMHPKFSQGSAAGCVSETDKNNVVADPVYSAEDDAAIEKHIRETVTTSWHSMGTCPMRPQSKGGVVDERLDVHGVKGLKVVDLSVVGQIAANTNNTAFIVGEKGAEILIEELRSKS